MDTLICLDIDGTITDDRSSVPLEIRKYLKELILQGYTLFLETGRSFTFASQTLTEFDFPFYIAAQNGSIALKMPEKQEVFRRYLDRSFLYTIDQIFSREDKGYLVYSGYEKGDFFYFKKEHFSKEDLFYIEALQTREGVIGKHVTTFDKIDSFPLIKGIGSQEKMQELKNAFLQTDLFQVSLNKDPFKEDIELLLLTHKEVSKGFALQSLKKDLGIKRVIAAGDDDNDKSMLEVADIKIVIDSAPEKLKQMADILCPGPKDLGILSALKKVL